MLDHVLAPQVVTVDFGLEPAFNVLHSFGALNLVDKLSGLGEWTVKTAAALTDEQRIANALLFEILGVAYHTLQLGNRWSTFEAYLTDLAARDPYEIRDNFLEEARAHVMSGLKDDAPDNAALLDNFDVFQAWYQRQAQQGHDEVKVELLRPAHTLLNDPPALLNLMVTHFQTLWDEFMAEEWERCLPMLKESVAAFKSLNFSGLTLFEAIRAVTGRDLRIAWGDKTGYWEKVEKIIFVPSNHIGPYVSNFVDLRNPTLMGLLFGARLPKGVQTGSSDLNRSELLVRLNGLTDDTRLRILELVRQEGELCAQDIITKLGLSQSSVSRHLGQLSATGYLVERRREVAKCYSLNTERIEDTLQALANFFKKH